MGAPACAKAIVQGIPRIFLRRLLLPPLTSSSTTSPIISNVLRMEQDQTGHPRMQKRSIHRRCIFGEEPNHLIIHRVSFQVYPIIIIKIIQIHFESLFRVITLPLPLFRPKNV